MNVFYFMKRFPRRYKTALQQKIYSLTQTMMNQGYRVNFVSADQSHPQQYQQIKQYSINLINVSPKRISASLSSAGIKPDLAIFSSFQMEEMYSAYLYNKWNKCPRVLQINNAHWLTKWRKRRYGTNAQHFLIPKYNQNLYDSNSLFGEAQKKSILRSDFYFTPNDFLYFITKTYLKESDRISIISHGYPIREFSAQVRQQEYRPFDSRKHFYFLGDLSKQNANNTIHALIHSIWPLIKRQIPQAQLHIYSSQTNLKINSKSTFQKNGVYFKGYVDNLDELQKYKMLLYPTTSTTGLKSKVVQSWLHHIPVVTTPIGAQGMFYQLLDAKYGMTQQQNASGFVNQREFTHQQTAGQTKLRNYYQSNVFNHKQAQKLMFGGSFYNFSYLQFAKSAIQLYNDKEKWNSALKIGQKTILKNQNQKQLQINLKQVLMKMQVSSYTARGKQAYQQQWRRFIKLKQYEKKVHTYP